VAVVFAADWEAPVVVFSAALPAAASVARRRGRDNTCQSMRLSQKATGRVLVLLAFGTLAATAMTSAWRKERAPGFEKQLGALNRDKQH
jgi:hypothetical protein